MQAIFETIFDIVYLITAFTIGIIIILRKTGYKLFGITVLVLAFGDSFHLVPRMYSLITDTFSQNYMALGFGKAVTSVTMTIFYVMLYHFLLNQFNKEKSSKLTLVIYSLAAVRIVLCLFPQNGWMTKNPSYLWGIIRNIPFAALGIVMIVLYYKAAGTSKGDPFRFAWLAILLSFGFYIPVVLFADKFPVAGVLMLPKTVCYVWIVLMGYRASGNKKHS